MGIIVIIHNIAEKWEHLGTAIRIFSLFSASLRTLIVIWSFNDIDLIGSYLLLRNYCKHNNYPMMKKHSLIVTVSTVINEEPTGKFENRSTLSLKLKIYTCMSVTQIVFSC